jgi:hypothetical protein
VPFSECYYFAQHRRDRKEGGGEEDVFFQGRYLDDLERRNGEWRIILRRGLSDYTSPRRLPPPPMRNGPPGSIARNIPAMITTGCGSRFMEDRRCAH